jgi:nitroreductase
MKLSDGKNIARDIIRNHEETKHHYDRYARSAGYMDWDNQPNPFRFYEETRFGPMEEEHPDLLCVVHPHQPLKIPRRLSKAIISAFKEVAFTGRPNSLSNQPVNWEIIYATAKLTRKPASDAHQHKSTHQEGYRQDPCRLAAAKIIRQRRSATAFSLGMIACFKDPVTRKPFSYRQLFWESGMIGQVLYLAAEAQGVRGTGIGCFFDDAVHEILGFADNQYQSLYHFTIGKPIEDSRLTTYPAYHHLIR